MGHPGIRPGDSVSVARDIGRLEDPHYAKAGQTGVVTETFKVVQDSEWDAQRQIPSPVGVIHAKVKMNLPGKPIKTFRLTSLIRQ